MYGISRRTPYVLALAALFLLVGCIFPSSRPVTASTIALERVGPTFSQPLLVVATPAHPDALFVVEKIGRIQVLMAGELQSEPLLDIRGQVSSGFEQGLLGLAFHPDFAANGLFYINYTDLAGNTQIVRYQAAPGTLTADPATATTLLSIEQPAANHNGGMLAFGPDGYLYIATGDGGRAGDPWGNAQNRGTLLGKLLRIDVDTGTPYAVPPTNPFVDDSSARPEIWAFGLRNPWRFSFDRQTEDLYIADVGQNAWEEVNFEPAGHPGGRNYGWNTMEGTHCYPESANCNRDGLVLPVIEYSHQATGGCSITGGYVYRGKALSSLYGHYIFGDYCSGEIWAATPGANDSLGNMTSLLRTDLQISSFGEDNDGELYVTDIRGGGVYRIIPAS